MKDAELFSAVVDKLVAVGAWRRVTSIRIGGGEPALVPASAAAGVHVGVCVEMLPEVAADPPRLASDSPDRDDEVMYGSAGG